MGADLLAHLTNLKMKIILSALLFSLALADADPQYLPYYFASKPQLPLQWSHFLPTQPAPKAVTRQVADEVLGGVEGDKDMAINYITGAEEKADARRRTGCPSKVRVDHSPFSCNKNSEGPYKENPNYFGVYERQGKIN